MHIDRQDRDVTGIALSAALGFAVGAIGGLLLRELFAELDTEPVKRAVRRLADADEEEVEDLSSVENAVVAAWEEDSDVRPLALTVEALGDGIVELTGTAPNQMTRALAGDVARSVPGVDVIVNRIDIETNTSHAPEVDLAPEAG